MSKFRTFVIAFAAGAATGAVLALLFTPMTGRKLQKKVGAVADRVIDHVDEVQRTVRKIARA